MWERNIPYILRSVIYQNFHEFNLPQGEWETECDWAESSVTQKK